MDFDLLPAWLTVLAVGPIFGGDDDPDDTDDAGAENADDEEVDEDDESDESDEGEEDEPKGKTPEEKLRDSRRKLREERRRNRQLEADLQVALEMAESGEGSNDDDAESDLLEAYHELQNNYSEAISLLEGMAVEKAIGNSKHQFEDTETVLALIDAQDLEVDLRTGEVDGLEDQLEDLAKKKPFLLKKKESKGKPDSGDASRNGRQRDRNRKKSAKEWAESNPAYSILTR